MAKVIAGTLLVLLCAAGALLAAEQRFDPAARAKAIARFIDDQTVLIVRVDLARIQVDPFVDELARLAPDVAAAEKEMRADWKRFQQVLPRAGGKGLYVVISFADVLRDAPFFVVPFAEGADERQLASLFTGQMKFQGRIDGALLAATSRAAQRLKSLKPKHRPELEEAFHAAGDTTIQLLLLPPRYAQRVVEELMPTLPEEAGGGPSTILTRGLLWAAVGIDSPPQMSLRVVIQSQSQQAAERLRAKWFKLITFLSAQQKTRELLTDFDRAARLLTPRVEGSRLVLTLSHKDGSLNALLAAVRPPIEAARSRAQRRQSINSLKQLALAMHVYHDAKKTFPPVGSSDAGGKLLLSWRVHILPYVDQGELYRQFHLDEPWDSPHNRKLIGKMPAFFRCPASKLAQKQGLSTYRVVSGEGTVFPVGKAIPIKEIKDGTSNTIMIVEVDDRHAVIWTKPEGLPFDRDNPARGLGGQLKDGFHAAFCDGSVRLIPKSIKPEILRWLLLRNDGNLIPPSNEW